MSYSFRAIALDYDGTLTEGGRPKKHVLDALTRARAEERKLVLVTGRILNELRSDFPDVSDFFDAIVAENGAVLHNASGTRLLCRPLPPQLCAALVKRGVPSRSGQVLLASQAIHASTILEEIGRLGLECELIRNRGELMVLPMGISKGTGLYEALGDLGISRHSTIGIGDGENDHSLLEACEVGVAVGNAIDALKGRADVVLSQNAGDGVAALLSGPLVRGEVSVQSKRWRVPLGEFEDGATVEVPASGVNVLISGGSGSGKSYLAGMFAERLIKLGYSLVLLDPEGDHASLGRIRGVLVVGGNYPLPDPSRINALVHHRFGSVVVDLSHLQAAERVTYSRDALMALRRQRTETGLPHWIFFDEAHSLVGASSLARDAYDPSQKGCCLVTYHPEELDEKALNNTDYFFFPLGNEQADRLKEVLKVAGVNEVDPAWTNACSGRGRALRVASRGQKPELFRLGLRSSQHVRHWHKYIAEQLPPHHHFIFRDDRSDVGRSAGNVAEFHHELLQVSDAVISHHAVRSDFSRWVREVLQDRDLADEIARAERELPRGAGAVRVAVLQAVESRYQDKALMPAV
jgi:hydroxymethylpyrimidine pyrophosphatase-like HAD family hydrolase